jgi:hypothetical protein
MRAVVNGAVIEKVVEESALRVKGVGLIKAECLVDMST